MVAGGRGFSRVGDGAVEQIERDFGLAGYLALLCAGTLVGRHDDAGGDWLAVLVDANLHGFKAAEYFVTLGAVLSILLCSSPALEANHFIVGRSKESLKVRGPNVQGALLFGHVCMFVINRRRYASWRVVQHTADMVDGSAQLGHAGRGGAPEVVDLPIDQRLAPILRQRLVDLLLDSQLGLAVAAYRTLAAGGRKDIRPIEAGQGGQDFNGPDAVIQPGDPADTVLIRRERLKKRRRPRSNGRVYEISFTADDGFENCTGDVQVSVPRRRKRDAVDDGQFFDSTQP